MAFPSPDFLKDLDLLKLSVLLIDECPGMPSGCFTIYFEGINTRGTLDHVKHSLWHCVLFRFSLKNLLSFHLLRESCAAAWQASKERSFGISMQLGSYPSCPSRVEGWRYAAFCPYL
ncbi:MAG: hypothetical protein ACRDT3_15950 [Glutamicibacter sp.]